MFNCWTLYLSSSTSYLVTRVAIEFSRSWKGLARPSRGLRQKGHWASLGIGALCTLSPCSAPRSLLSAVCTPTLSQPWGRA